MENSNSSENNVKHDPLGKIIFGVIVIWLGISLLLNERNYFEGSEWWAIFLVGLGIIFFIEAAIRMIRPELQKHYVGKIIAGSVLIAIGANNINEMENWWPMILVAVGVIIIFLSLQKDKNKT